MSPNRLTPPPISFGRHHARWAVALGDGGLVHLRQDYSDLYFVVHADTNRLYDALRAQAGNQFDANPCPPFAELPNDPKFADVARPMRQSADYPVPLPELCHYGGAITFADGMTRTRWLIFHRAATFPIAATESSVAALHALIGLTDHPPRLAAALAAPPGATSPRGTL